MEKRKFARIIENGEFGQILLFIDDCPETNFPMLSMMFEIDSCRGRMNNIAKEETEEAVDKLVVVMEERKEEDIVKMLKELNGAGKLN